MNSVNVVPRMTPLCFREMAILKFWRTSLSSRTDIRMTPSLVFFMYIGYGLEYILKYR